MLEEVDIPRCSPESTIDELTLSEVSNNITSMLEDMNSFQFHAKYYYESDGHYAPGQLAMEMKGKYSNMKPDPDFFMTPISTHYFQSQTEVVDLHTLAQTKAIIIDDMSWVKLPNSSGWIEQSIDSESYFLDPVFNEPEALGPFYFLSTLYYQGYADNLIGRVEKLEEEGMTITHRCWHADPDLPNPNEPSFFLWHWDQLYTALVDPEIHLWLNEDETELFRIAITGKQVADVYLDIGVDEHDPPNNLFYSVELSDVNQSIQIEAPADDQIILSIPEPIDPSDTGQVFETGQFPIPDGAVEIADPLLEEYEEGDFSGIKPREFTMVGQGNTYFWMSDNLRPAWREMPYELRPVYESQSDLPSLFDFYVKTLQAQGWQLESANFTFGRETYYLVFRNDSVTLPIMFEGRVDKPARIWAFLPQDESIDSAIQLAWTEFQLDENDVGFPQALLIDQLDRVWIGGNDGIAVYDGTSWTKHLHDLRVTSLALDPQGNIWATTEDGIVAYDGSEWYTPEHANDVSFENGLITSTFDQSGRLWTSINIDKYHIAIFDRTNWRFFTSDAFTQCDINIFFEDSQGRMWLGKEDLNDLFFIDGGEWYQVVGDENTPLEEDECSGEKCLAFEAGQCSTSLFEGINNIVEDSTGRIWVGYTTGLKHFDGQSWTHYDADTGELPFEYISKMIIDHFDRIWVLSDEGGVHMLDDTGNWQSFFPKSDIRLSWVEDVAVDSEGNIWFTGGLIYRLEPPTP